MRKFFLEEDEPRKFGVEALLVLYDTLFPFMGGFFFAVFESPMWLVFLFSPLLLRFRKVKRYVYVE